MDNIDNKVYSYIFHYLSPYFDKIIKDLDPLAKNFNIIDHYLFYKTIKDYLKINFSFDLNKDGLQKYYPYLDLSKYSSDEIEVMLIQKFLNYTGFNLYPIIEYNDNFFSKYLKLSDHHGIGLI